MTRQATTNLAEAMQPQAFRDNYAIDDADEADLRGFIEQSNVGAVLVHPTRQNLLDMTARLVENWSKHGSTDVLPQEPEWTILESYSQEVAVAVWEEVPKSTEARFEQVPLSLLSTRAIACVDPHAAIRFASAVSLKALWMEQQRTSAQVSPACRVSLSRTRKTVIAPGGFERRNARISELRAQFPFILKTDIAACYPSIQPLNPQVIPWFANSLSGKEFARLGLTSLPVGGCQARWLAELVLSEAVDRPLMRHGFQLVRYMDDIWIGVPAANRAQEAIGIVTENLAMKGLSLNKAKTELLKSAALNPSSPAPTPSELRGLLKAGGDRVAIMLGLRGLRDRVPRLGNRERYRWAGVLGKRIAEHPGNTTDILRALLAVADGSLDSDIAANVLNLMKSPFSVTRARVIELLSRHAVPEVIAAARTLATEDQSPLVRRECVFALTRARDRRGLKRVLGEPARSGTERAARVIAAAALDVQTMMPNLSHLEKLLHQAAQDYGLGPALAPYRART